MCGIIATISNNSISQKCVNILFNGLEQIQNRGYDSAGICTINNNKFIIDKFASNIIGDKHISSLEKIKKNLSNHENSNIGIAHTRWATHGPKTDINSHPHMSMDNKFSLVHNGIIENYKELKEMLIKEGYIFTSQTDTEVIVQLLSFIYKKKGDIIETINETIKLLSGTWGLAILCIDSPDIIYCTRHGSPLLISYSDDFAIISSEQSGFSNNVNNYFVLKNDDICVLKKELNKIIIKTNHSYELKKITLCLNNNTPYPFKHWTIKEIYEQNESINRAISFGGRLLSLEEVKLGGLEINKEKLMKIDNIIILGCGSSYNAGLLGSYYFKELCNFNCVLIIDGAEFNENDIPNYGVTGLLFLSQSGETKDLYRCIKIANEKNLLTIGVINVVDSLIAREVDCGCYLNAGREVAVASTKSFTSQCVILSMVAIWFSQNKKINCEKRYKFIKDLYNLQMDINNLLLKLEENISENILKVFNHSSCFILGKGKSEAIAREGSLKIKEITYIHSEGCSISSLKHGPFALLNDDFPIIILSTNSEDYITVENIYNEVKSRNAKIILITNNEEYLNNNNFDKDLILMTPYNKTYNDLLPVIYLQMIAYKLAIYKGINPDFPKNLAKVVTV